MQGDSGDLGTWGTWGTLFRDVGGNVSCGVVAALVTTGSCDFRLTHSREFATSIRRRLSEYAAPWDAEARV